MFSLWGKRGTRTCCTHNTHSIKAYFIAMTYLFMDGHFYSLIPALLSELVFLHLSWSLADRFSQSCCEYDIIIFMHNSSMRMRYCWGPSFAINWALTVVWCWPWHVSLPMIPSWKKWQQAPFFTCNILVNWHDEKMHFICYSMKPCNM